MKDLWAHLQAVNNQEFNPMVDEHMEWWDPMILEASMHQCHPRLCVLRVVACEAALDFERLEVAVFFYLGRVGSPLRFCVSRMGVCSC